MVAPATTGVAFPTKYHLTVAPAGKNVAVRVKFNPLHIAVSLPALTVHCPEAWILKIEKNKIERKAKTIFFIQSNILLSKKTNLIL